jgi:hypothetical protein
MKIELEAAAAYDASHSMNTLKRTFFSTLRYI